MRDLHHNIKANLLIGPVALSADNTPAALNFDGYDAKTFLVLVGVGGITFDASNKIEVKVTHSDDGTTYTAVTDDDVEITAEDGSAGSVASGGIVLSLVAAHAAAGITKVGYFGGKRYQKVLLDFSGAHGTATPVAVVELLGHKKAFNLP